MLPVMQTICPKRQDIALIFVALGGCHAGNDMLWRASVVRGGHQSTSGLHYLYFNSMGNTNTKEYNPNGPTVPRPRSGSDSLAALFGQSPGRTGRALSGDRSGHGKSDSRIDGQETPKTAREIARERRKAERDAAYACPVDFLETVDGGHLFPHGVYAGAQDFKGSVVRDIIVSRRLAPFYRPLETYEPNWTDEELLMAVLDCHSQLPGGALHAEASALSIAQFGRIKQQNKLTIKQDTDAAAGADSLGLPTPPGSCDDKATAELSENVQALEVSSTRSETESESASEPNETKIAKEQDLASEQEPSLESQILLLYRCIHECPICFLLYPRLNKTSCCNQSICTECFVQIKRRPPHPANSDTQANESTEIQGELTMDPAACPYCAAPELSVKFEAPPFTWGLPPTCNDATPQCTTTTAVSVDDVRPDWHLTLASARRRAARRSAASQALVRRALLHNSATESGEGGRRRSATVAETRTTATRQRRRSTLGDLVGTSRLTPAQARELESRMIESVIQQSLREQ